MSDPPGDPNPSPTEGDQLRAIEARLEHERPVPRPAFRGELRRSLLAGFARRRPARVRRLIAAYAGSGFCLLAVAALGVAGAGPLAA